MAYGINPETGIQKLDRIDENALLQIIWMNSIV